MPVVRTVMALRLAMVEKLNSVTHQNPQNSFSIEASADANDFDLLDRRPSIFTDRLRGLEASFWKNRRAQAMGQTSCRQLKTHR
jgi:hypothetical protein